VDSGHQKDELFDTPRWVRTFWGGAVQLHKYILISLVKEPNSITLVFQIDKGWIS
jgi:hypothetical protein